ncbi:MAG TPA: BlaI/MecI/CopY family transcriptional regulator, partial [Longimicrobium sp.]|uniref:BlaI/MecI/CopY family transcriptional regulator n=1 Tax=Longimicrobium sp. TaxID=2029185 RepID=UPI002EDA4CA4
LGEDLAYTSVLSALQTLEEKRFVRHEAEGRAYRYFPTVAPENAGRSVMARIRDAVFQGSAERTLAARQPAARPRRQPRTAARIPSSPGRRTCCRTRRAGRTR